MLTSIWSHAKKIMVDSKIRTRHQWFPNLRVTRHMSYARHQRLCRRFCASWSKSGIGKNSAYWLEYFSFENIFRRKQILLGPLKWIVCVNFSGIFYYLLNITIRHCMIWIWFIIIEPLTLGAAIYLKVLNITFRQQILP